MKYFLHDTNAFQDEKITELFIHFGYEGIGLFFTTLEKLALQEKPIKTSVLKMQLSVGKKLEKCWSFMEEIGLLSSNNGETFNEQLLNFAGKYKSKNEKNAKRVAQWRENQSLKKDVTHYESITLPLRNDDKIKKSKVNKSKEFTAPTLSEVVAYFAENGYNEFLATKAFNYYASNDWKDSKNKKISVWKMKMQNWFKDEHKLQVIETKPVNNDGILYHNPQSDFVTYEKYLLNCKLYKLTPQPRDYKIHPEL